MSFFDRQTRIGLPHGLLCGLCGWLGLAATALASVEPSPPDEEALRIEESVQGLKREVIEINRKGLNLEEQGLYPSYRRVAVYVGVNQANWLLQHVNVRVDNEKATTRNYNDVEGRALARKGLHRLLYFNLDKGSHRIRLTFKAQPTDLKAKPDTKPKPEAPALPVVTGEFESVFTKGNAPLSLELSIGSDNEGRPLIKFTEWEPKAP
jgi:hypothetical protein